MHVKLPSVAANLFSGYRMAAYDEMFDAKEAPRPHYAPLHERLIELGPEELERRHKVADLTMRQQGITFTVYGRDQGVERIIPFDPIPRLIAAAEWDRHRARARSSAFARSTCFIHDVYHDRLDPQGPGRAPRAGLRRHRATGASASGCRSRATSTSMSRVST